MASEITRPEFDSLARRVNEMEANIGQLTGEVSVALRSIGKSPDQATGEEGSGIAKTVVDTKKDVGEIKDSLKNVCTSRELAVKEQLTNSEIALKKVQAFGGLITGATGVVAIIGSIITGIIWLLNH